MKTTATAEIALGTPISVTPALDRGASLETTAADWFAEGERAELALQCEDTSRLPEMYARVPDVPRTSRITAQLLPWGAVGLLALALVVVLVR